MAPTTLKTDFLEDSWSSPAIMSSSRICAEVSQQHCVKRRDDAPHRLSGS